METPLHHPEIEIYSFVIMPDHIHVLLRVREVLKVSGVSVFGYMMGACTGNFRKELPAEAEASDAVARQKGLIQSDERLSVFRKGVNDRILLRQGQLHTLKEYIIDNPRRLLVKRLYKDLFTRHVGLKIEGEEYVAFGNIYLLKLPMHAVHVRRVFTTEERKDYHGRCVAAAVEGVSLISPFLSRYEKDIMEEAIEKGGGIIRVSLSGFGERFKPSGREFELCAEGRLLLLARVGSSLHEGKLRREDAVALNKVAETRKSLSQVKGRLLI